MSVADPLGGLGGSGLPEWPAGEEQEASADPAGRRPSRPAAPATLALLAVLAAFFAVQIALSPRHDGADPLLMYRLGSLHAPSIGDGDFFRLGSYAFLHVGIAHFVINAYALWILMRPVEGSLGSAVALGLFAASALAGGAASAAHAGLSDQVWQQAAGASGGIFGLFGATGALWFRLRHHLPRETVRVAMRSLFVNLLVNAAIAFIAPVDSFAHAGGFVAGALLALAVPMRALPSRPWQTPARWLLIGSALVLAAMEGAAVARAVHPRPRVLTTDGLEAQAPFWLPQVAPGEAVSVEGLAARLFRDPGPPAPAGPALTLSGRSWTEPAVAGVGSHGAVVLETPAGGGRVAVEVRCYTTACEPQVRPVAEALAGSIRIAR